MWKTIHFHNGSYAIGTKSHSQQTGELQFECVDLIPKATL